MQLVADGHTSIEISEITGASHRTIENHMYKLKRNFQCKSLTHLTLNSLL